MNISPQLFRGLLAVSLATVWLVTPAFSQSGAVNPLRQARGSAPATQAPTSSVETARTSSQTVQRASHTAQASPMRPTGFDGAASRFASNQRSVIAPSQSPARQQPLTETRILGSELLEGDVIYEGDMIFEEGGKGPIVGTSCCGGGGCLQCCAIPCPQICFDNFEVFAGVQGFTGPVNRGQTGSFGFHEGFNWGAPVPCFGALGAQLGLQTTQSNLSGAEFTDETRHQLFATGGLFRRVDWGLQGGVVFDYLSDDWYANTSLAQMRGEMSWVFPCLHELGFWFASSTRNDTQVSTFSNGAAAITETFESTNLYAFFYRHHFEALEGAQARVYAGWTGDSDGLIGADLRLPLSCDWALEGGFTYLIPEQATGVVGRGHAEESWNIGMSLVWYPGARSAYGNDYYRPLFNVANNGSFMVGRQ
ncbi:MAG: hypothetical protein H6822_23750 [Planctomycetaceae bacterium]|nr:hypothetical protein [Planctomycetales bacterium]MCB9925214.1 hypothetical protein [Planctomycetaceae bacterium]